MSYDDMMGLEFGDYGGLGAWIDMEMVKDTAIAGAAGLGAVMATNWALGQLTEKVDFLKREDPNMQRIQNGVIQLGVGIAAGSYIGRYSPEAGLGATVVLGALGIANLLNGTILKDKPVSLAEMPEDMALAGSYGEYDSSMEALAALEATNVSSAPGAFQGFADPTVTPESLMGTMVQEESLGAYAPYLS